jgi:hypothetical protein
MNDDLGINFEYEIKAHFYTGILWNFYWHMNFK